MKVPPTKKEGTTSESLQKVSPSDEETAKREISSMMSLSSSKKSFDPSSQETHTCKTKITFTDNDLLFGKTLQSSFVYGGSCAREEDKYNLN